MKSRVATRYFAPRAERLRVQIVRGLQSRLKSILRRAVEAVKPFAHGRDVEDGARDVPAVKAALAATRVLANPTAFPTLEAALWTGLAEVSEHGLLDVEEVPEPDTPACSAARPVKPRRK